MKKIFLVLVGIILLISFVYRSRFYWEFPPVEDNFDEFAAAWLGLSLVKTGIPTSWSFIQDYQAGNPREEKIVFNGLTYEFRDQAASLTNFADFPKPLAVGRELSLDGYRSHFSIVLPYLEQPPLGGIIVSLPLFINKVQNFSAVSLRTLRAPFVIYGCLSVFLVMVLSRYWYGEKVAFWAGLLYATIPTIVLGSRMALPENILTVLLLLEIIFLEKKYFLPALVLSFFAPLIKPFGLALPLLAAAWFYFQEKRLTKPLIFVFAAMAAISLYLIYGFYYDRATFLMVLNYQSKRFFPGPQILILKILIPRITRIFLDGWIFFGWLALFVLAWKEKVKKHFPLLLVSGVYLFILLFFGGEEYGWYKLPLYPFLIIAAAYLINQIINRADFFGSMLFLLLGPMTSFFWGLGPNNWNSYLIYFRIFLIGASFLYLTHFFSKNQLWKLVRQGFLIFIILASLYMNTRVINNVREIWSLLRNRTSLIIERE